MHDFFAGEAVDDRRHGGDSDGPGFRSHCVSGGRFQRFEGFVEILTIASGVTDTIFVRSNLYWATKNGPYDPHLKKCHSRGV